jgi:hypothetical protein
VTNTEEELNPSDDILIVFPNPARSGKIQIKYKDFSSVQILDIYGNKVLENAQTEIDVSSLSKGLYFIRLYSNEQSNPIVERFIIE